MAWGFGTGWGDGDSHKFGWIFKQSTAVKKEEDVINSHSLVDYDEDNAAQLIDASYSSASSFNMVDNFQNQAQIINEWRAMALHPDVEDAIDDVVNAIASTDDVETVISANLERVDLSDSIKEKILSEFNYITRLLNFNMTAYEKVKLWYVDGRIIFQCIVDENKPENGILKISNLDPRAIRKFRKVKKQLNPDTKLDMIVSSEDFYKYNPMYANDISASTVTNNNHVKASIVQRGQTLDLSNDSIVFCHSGVISPTTGIVLSHLEKARKPLNNLKMLEDAVVVYRITRAPSRRIFYVDVGSLPPKQAEQYVQKIMNNYRNKLSYDPVSGTVKGTPHQVSMLEDYWLPRRDGSRGTQIDTLPDGEANNRLEDLSYFQKKLFKSLNVPISRLQPEANIIFGGNGGGELSRDEWKFSKFISRLRRRFSALFSELLKRQLILKRIITQDEWDEKVAPFIRFEYAADGYMKEQSEAEQFHQKIAMLEEVEQFVGTYFSKEYIQHKVLKMSDEDINIMDKQIKKEVGKTVAKPNMINDPEEIETKPSNAPKEKETKSIKDKTSDSK